MKVSIAMATYNGAQYLRAQLQSFVDQTRQPDELVITDDCSSDSTLAVLSDIVESAQFEFVLNQNERQLGYAQNFNKALALSSGDIVFLSDQDDVWLDKKIDTVIKFFEQEPDKYLIIHDLEYCNEALKAVGQTKLDRLKSIGAGDRSYVTGMATAVRRELLDVCLPIPMNSLITHDLWLHECAYLLGVKKVIPQVLALYRRHGSNVTVTSMINGAGKTSLFSFIKRSDVDEVKRAINTKIAVLTELLSWLERAEVIIFYKTKVNPRMQNFEKKRSALRRELTHAQMRLNLLDSNKLARVALAIKLYCEHGYDDFMGMKSLMKDILVKK